MVMLAAMAMVAYIRALGNHSYGHSQSGRMIILIPLSDTFQQDTDKHNEKQTEHKEKEDFKQSQSKSESQPCTPLF